MDIEKSETLDQKINRVANVLNGAENDWEQHVNDLAYGRPSVGGKLSENVKAMKALGEAKKVLAKGSEAPGMGTLENFVKSFEIALGHEDEDLSPEGLEGRRRLNEQGSP